MNNEEKKYEIIYGIHPIVELLKAKRRSLYRIYTTKERPQRWNEIAERLTKKTEIISTTRDVLGKICQSTDHQGIVAYASPFPFRKQFFNPTKQKKLILLDGIQDPRNTGAIIRSVYCTGFNGIIVCKKGASPLTATAIKSSAGLAEHMEIYQAPSASAAMTLLKQAGYTSYMALLNGKDARDVEFNEPLCVVIGSEGTGISREIMNQGIAITLPQKTADISYNASVAAGILLFLVSSKTGGL
jgi:23S rRNA (guanosine2251-2'-O)-methyltransferase